MKPEISSKLIDAKAKAKLKEELKAQGALIEGTSKMAHVIDIINLSIRTSRTRDEKKEVPNGTFVTAFTGTGESRNVSTVEKFGAHLIPGPLSNPNRDSKLQQESKVSSEYYVPPEEIEKIGQSALKKFAEDIVSFYNQGKSQPEVIKWLLTGHSRGGIIARWLLNDHPEVKNVVLDNGFRIEISPKHKSIKIFHNDKPVQTYQLQADFIDFSGTAGLGTKDEYSPKGFYPNSYLSFLAADDHFWGAYPGYGIGMKPQNQRRNNFDLEQTSSVLYVHLPVRHPIITKARDKQIVHMEIEMLTTYLHLRQAGYEIDFDKFKIPYYVAEPGKSTPTLHFLHIKLHDGTSLSADNCDVKKCLVTIKEKYAELQAQQQQGTYGKKGSDPINLHEQTDRHKLVLLSNHYKTAIEERLANALDAKSKSPKERLKDFCSPEMSKEEILFRDFAQKLIGKKKFINDPGINLDDPGFNNEVNEEVFLHLKTAAHLQDRRFVDQIFQVVDNHFSKQNREVPTGETIYSYQAAIPVTQTRKLSTLKKREVEKWCQFLLHQNTPREKVKTKLLTMLANDFTKDYQAGVINIETYINCQKALDSLTPKSARPYLDSRQLEEKSTKTILLQQLIDHKRWNTETTKGKVVNSCSFFSNKSSNCPDGIQKLRNLLKNKPQELIAEAPKIANERLTKRLVTRSEATEDFYKLLSHANDPTISDTMMIKALEAFAAKHNFALTKVNLVNTHEESSTPRMVL